MSDEYNRRPRIVKWLHRVWGTRTWEHFQRHGHWPVFRREDQIYDTNVCGFIQCLRCCDDE